MQSFVLPPSPALAPYVAFYKTFQTERAEPLPTLLGLHNDSVQITLNFGTPVRVTNGGAEALSSPLMVSGAALHADFINITGGIDAVLVAFRPGCAGLFLHMPTAEFAGQFTDLEALWPADLTQMSYDLEGLSPLQRIRRLETFLLSRLDERFQVPREVKGALRLLEGAKGQVRIRTLAERVGVNERKLQRALIRSIGLTPKQLVRTLRIRRAAEALRSAPGANWAQLAVEHGFYDQAHLTNEMVHLLKHTPTEFVQLGDAQGSYISKHTF